MELSKLIRRELVLLDLKARNKQEAIEEITTLLSNDKKIMSKDGVLKAILEREGLGTTGIGNSLAIPHARTTAVKDIVIAFARSKEGIDFEALDKKPVNLFFMVVGPQEKNEEYLKVMSNLAHLFSKEENRQSLMKAATAEEVIRLIAQMEENVR